MEEAVARCRMQRHLAYLDIQRSFTEQLKLSQILSDRLEAMAAHAAGLQGVITGALAELRADNKGRRRKRDAEATQVVAEGEPLPSRGGGAAGAQLAGAPVPGLRHTPTPLSPFTLTVPAAAGSPSSVSLATSSPHCRNNDSDSLSNGITGTAALRLTPAAVPPAVPAAAPRPLLSATWPQSPLGGVAVSPPAAASPLALPVRMPSCGSPPLPLLPSMGSSPPPLPSDPSSGSLPAAPSPPLPESPTAAAAAAAVTAVNPAAKAGRKRSLDASLSPLPPPQPSALLDQVLSTAGSGLGFGLGSPSGSGSGSGTEQAGDDDAPGARALKVLRMLEASTRTGTGTKRLHADGGTATAPPQLSATAPAPAGAGGAAATAAAAVGCEEQQRRAQALDEQLRQSALLQRLWQQHQQQSQQLQQQQLALSLLRLREGQRVPGQGQGQEQRAKKQRGRQQGAAWGDAGQRQQLLQLQPSPARAQAAAAATAAVPTLLHGPLALGPSYFSHPYVVQQLQQQSLLRQAAAAAAAAPPSPPPAPVAGPQGVRDVAAARWAAAVGAPLRLHCQPDAVQSPDACPQPHVAVAAAAAAGPLPPFSPAPTALQWGQVAPRNGSGLAGAHLLPAQPLPPPALAPVAAGGPSAGAPWLPPPLPPGIPFPSVGTAAAASMPPLSPAACPHPGPAASGAAGPAVQVGLPGGAGGLPLAACGWVDECEAAAAAAGMDDLLDGEGPDELLLLGACA